MAVFTTVSEAELTAWLAEYSLGQLLELQGIASGIENTNYFVTTSNGRYVLTLFERLSAAELPFYLNLMAHLARHGIPCPAPVADLNDAYLGELNGKPAALVTRLPGRSLERPGPEACAGARPDRPLPGRADRQARRAGHAPARALARAPGTRGVRGARRARRAH